MKLTVLLFCLLVGPVQADDANDPQESVSRIKMERLIYKLMQQTQEIDKLERELEAAKRGTVCA